MISLLVVHLFACSKDCFQIKKNSINDKNKILPVYIWPYDLSSCIIGHAPDILWLITQKYKWFEHMGINELNYEITWNLISKS